MKKELMFPFFAARIVTVITVFVIILSPEHPDPYVWADILLCFCVGVLWALGDLMLKERK